MKEQRKKIARQLLAIVTASLLGLTACTDSRDQQEAESNLPQAADMATSGENEEDSAAALAGLDSNPDTKFADYADRYLSKLTLVARDGTIKKGSSFEVNYKQLPAFKAISHIPDRKQAFFDYLRPAIEYQNQLIRERRQILKGIEIKLREAEKLSSAQQKYMTSMRERYRVPEESTTNEAVALLLRRVDTLPVSMVLAQAAMESAWGTSRFAREANNLFGQWCFSKGCGVVPAQRSKGMKHEVRKFSSVDKAIGAYFLNINSYPTYALTRDIRETLRAKGKPLTGHALVAGLEKYSARGQEYIEELRSMIRTNKLES
jgi:Bax protein